MFFDTILRYLEYFFSYNIIDLNSYKFTKCMVFYKSTNELITVEYEIPQILYFTLSIDVESIYKIEKDNEDIYVLFIADTVSFKTELPYYGECKKLKYEIIDSDGIPLPMKYGDETLYKLDLTKDGDLQKFNRYHRYIYCQVYWDTHNDILDIRIPYEFDEYPFDKYFNNIVELRKKSNNHYVLYSTSPPPISILSEFSLKYSLNLYTQKRMLNFRRVSSVHKIKFI